MKSMILTLALMVSALAHADVYISGGIAGGYDTAYCPQGYVIDYCSFDTWACDNTTQGRNYCGADSRNNRPCRFQGRCVRNQPQTVTIQGGIAGGYDIAYCPQGFTIRYCSFDTNSCDNTSQGYDYCAADSRNNRPCRFQGVCERW